MKRTIAIAAFLTAVATAAATLLFRGVPASPASAPQSIDIAAAPRDVEIRHELVPIAATPAAAALPRLAAAAAPTVPAAARVRERKPENQALIAKARRALIGDGRHRPEPFPRIK